MNIQRHSTPNSVGAGVIISITTAVIVNPDGTRVQCGRTYDLRNDRMFMFRTLFGA